jgi:CrcB protein
MKEFALIVAGSALGGVARYWLTGLVARWRGETFPWGTIAVNVSGAFAIGAFAAVASMYDALAGPGAWQFCVIGLLGSYTTVSAFSLQTLALVQEGEAWRAAGNVLLSLGLCLSAAALGLSAASLLPRIG